MATITNSNLFSGPRANILALLDDRSNVADPISVSTQFRKFIYSREPDSKGNTFAGYPFIVLHAAEMNEEQAGQSVDMKSQFVNWTIELEVFASDRGHNNKDGQGLTHVDAISDDIVQTLSDKTNRITLKATRMSFVRVNASGIVEVPSKQEMTYQRSMVITFRTKMQVSS